MSEDVAFGFERLRVWQDAVDLADNVYDFTWAFPKAELFGLTMQLRRAAVSVAANIAEGASRASGKDQARFFEIAYGSVSEVATLVHIAKRQGFADEAAATILRRCLFELSRMLSGLKRSALTVGKGSLNAQR